MGNWVKHEPKPAYTEVSAELFKKLMFKLTMYLKRQEKNGGKLNLNKVCPEMRVWMKQWIEVYKHDPQLACFMIIIFHHVNLGVHKFEYPKGNKFNVTAINSFQDLNEVAEIANVTFKNFSDE